MRRLPASNTSLRAPPDSTKVEPFRSPRGAGGLSPCALLRASPWFRGESGAWLPGRTDVAWGPGGSDSTESARRTAPWRLVSPTLSTPTLSSPTSGSAAREHAGRPRSRQPVPGLRRKARSRRGGRDSLLVLPHLQRRLPLGTPTTTPVACSRPLSTGHQPSSPSTCALRRRLAAWPRSGGPPLWGSLGALPPA